MSGSPFLPKGQILPMLRESRYRKLPLKGQIPIPAPGERADGPLRVSRAGRGDGADPRSDHHSLFFPKVQLGSSREEPFNNSRYRGHPWERELPGLGGAELSCRRWLCGREVSSFLRGEAHGAGSEPRPVQPWPPPAMGRPQPPWTTRARVPPPSR